VLAKHCIQAAIEMQPHYYITFLSMSSFISCENVLEEASVHLAIDVCVVCICLLVCACVCVCACMYLKFTLTMPFSSSSHHAYYFFSLGYSKMCSLNGDKKYRAFRCVGKNPVIPPSGA